MSTAETRLPRRDLRAYLFAGLDVAQGAMIGAIPWVLPGEHGWVDWTLYVLGSAMILSAPALLWGRRPGRLFVAATCLAYWVVGTTLVVLMAASASYLYGIYGAFGHTLGTAAAVLAAVVAIAFWLLPAHELAYLRAAGRRE